MPLDFQKFFVKNIQKIKNGLRPSPPPLSRQSLPPRGSREAADNFCLIVRKHDEARGSLDVRKGFPFLPKKMKFAEFFSGKGKAWNKADNFCLIVRKHDEARESLDVRQNFKLTSLGAARHSTCRACLKTAIRQGLPKGKASEEKGKSRFWRTVYFMRDLRRLLWRLSRRRLFLCALLWQAPRRYALLRPPKIRRRLR